MKVKTFYSIKLPVYLVALCTNNFATASSTLEAHVHGLSEMTIAADKHTIEISFISPAANIVGFEHTATTSAEIAAVEGAEVLLKSHKAMFEFSKRHCELEGESIDLSSLTNANKDHNDDGHHHASEDQHAGEHHHDDEDHGVGKEHQHQHQNKTHGVEKHDEPIGHSEVMTNYRYHCEKTSDLPTITVGIFKLFPGVQKIKAVWLTESQQGSVVLSEKSNVINLH